MNKNADELLPCPFCGGKATLNDTRHDERSGYNVTCKVACGTCGGAVSVTTNQDPNGWCNESTESLHTRAAVAWNAHPAARPQDGVAARCSCMFDAWQRNPYTVTLMKSVREDYQPKTGDGVAGLVAKWRSENGDYPESKRDCADELAAALAQPQPEKEDGPGSNTGHGHVWPRPDGGKARCGGPGICKPCGADALRWPTPSEQPAVVASAEGGEWPCPKCAEPYAPHEPECAAASAPVAKGDGNG